MKSVWSAVVSEQLTAGNVLLLLCYSFYLLWWLLAFHPTRPLHGWQSGWLLLPAFLTGIAGVVQVAKACRQTHGQTTGWLLPLPWLVGGGIGIYLLTIVVSVFMHRPVTTELILIVGWGGLMLAEITCLLALGHISRIGFIGFTVAAALCFTADLVCYFSYYRLQGVASYADGMLPLILAWLFSAGLLAASLAG